MNRQRLRLLEQARSVIVEAQVLIDHVLEDERAELEAQSELRQEGRQPREFSDEEIERVLRGGRQP
jgi:hypothetical protein